MRTLPLFFFSIISHFTALCQISWNVIFEILFFLSINYSTFLNNIFLYISYKIRHIHKTAYKFMQSVQKTKILSKTRKFFPKAL
jgi:hypothetical protein